MRFQKVFGPIMPGGSLGFRFILDGILCEDIEREYGKQRVDSVTGVYCKSKYSLPLRIYAKSYIPSYIKGCSILWPTQVNVYTLAFFDIEEKIGSAPAGKIDNMH